MWKRNTALFLFMTLTSVAFTPNCATLTRGRTQRIPVTSSLAGATVSVNGQQQGVTPLEIRLSRKQKCQVIRIESPGYNPVEVQLKRKRSVGPLIGNFLLGVITGAQLAFFYASARDINDEYIETYLAWLLGTAVCGGLFTLIDGSKGYALTPKELIVTLTKAGGTPRVDTILLDAEDFQSIRWIRVRRD